MKNTIFSYAHHVSRKPVRHGKEKVLKKKRICESTFTGPLSCVNEGNMDVYTDSARLTRLASDPEES